MIGFLADIISANRRLIEDVLLRLKRMELFKREKAGGKDGNSERSG